MDQPISSLMEKYVLAVDVDDTVDAVEELLDAHKLSCLPVVDAAGKVFGVISATDLVHFHRLRKNPKAEHAWEVCTHKVVEVSQEMTVKEAAKLMVDRKIHHLLVTDGESVKGIVSSIDLIRECFLKPL